MFEVGRTNEMSWTVGRDHLASAFGSGLVDVLATPVLVAFCEDCARSLVDPHLPPGQKTVGTSIRLDHVAATPFGIKVRVTARLVEVDRRRLRFEIEARDEIELVGRATHDRFIIDEERFEERVQAKSADAPSRPKSSTS